MMREVVEVVKKDPGADLRRLSNREKTLLIDRLRPAYSLSSMTCLLAIAPSSYHYHHARLGVDKYAGLRAEVAGAYGVEWPRCGPGTGTPARPTSQRHGEAGTPEPSAMTRRRRVAGSRSRGRRTR